MLTDEQEQHLYVGFFSLEWASQLPIASIGHHNRIVEDASDSFEDLLLLADLIKQFFEGGPEQQHKLRPDVRKPHLLVLALQFLQHSLDNLQTKLSIFSAVLGELAIYFYQFFYVLRSHLFHEVGD